MPNQPIKQTIEALPHTPAYKIHRYFARRPWNVFAALIRHYSQPGDIILDPFCGGGVTVIEALKLRRKVIGVDLNPMATFITKQEAAPVDLNQFKAAFQKIKKTVGRQLNALYETICPNCQNPAPAQWFEWSKVVECYNCHNEVTLPHTQKIAPATYLCPNCATKINTATQKPRPSTGIVSNANPTPDVSLEIRRETLVRLKLNCTHCGHKTEKAPTQYDFQKYERIEQNFYQIIKQGLWYPQDQIPLGKETRRLWYPIDEIPSGVNTREVLTKGFTRFYQLFTKRNLLALAILRREIAKIVNNPTRELMELVFSSTLDYSSRISRVVGGQGREITMHAFWPPNTPCENNVWFCFCKRFQAAIKGKLQSQKEIGDYYKPAKSFQDLTYGHATCLLLTQSSTNLSNIPDKSIDVIITDPPYGGNVNYTELSDFWAIWLKDTLDLKPNQLIDNRYEIIKNRCQGKGDAEYEDLLYQALKECHRLLKLTGWLVMTFHNRKFTVWRALLKAIRRAGFQLHPDGICYQGPIQAYTTTLHQKAAGAVLGDFIYSFKKADPAKVPKFHITDPENLIFQTAEELIKSNHGATTSEIYQKIIPTLVNANALDSVADLCQDLETLLKKRFVYQSQLRQEPKGLVERKLWTLNHETTDG